jgi:hypothetical protein
MKLFSPICCVILPFLEKSFMVTQKRVDAADEMALLSLLSLILTGAIECVILYVGWKYGQVEEDADLVWVLMLEAGAVFFALLGLIFSCVSAHHWGTGVAYARCCIMFLVFLMVVGAGAYLSWDLYLTP